MKDEICTTQNLSVRRLQWLYVNFRDSGRQASVWPEAETFSTDGGPLTGGSPLPDSTGPAAPSDHVKLPETPTLRCLIRTPLSPQSKEQDTKES